MSLDRSLDNATRNRRKRAKESNLFGGRASSSRPHVVAGGGGARRRSSSSSKKRQKTGNSKKRSRASRNQQRNDGGDDSDALGFLSQRPTRVKKLLRKDLCSGVSVLGVVESVNDERFDARVSLPNHLMATFTLADLSHAVTNGLAGSVHALEQRADPSHSSSSLPVLSQFVQEGQYVRCIVSEDQSPSSSSSSSSSSNACLKVTLNPALLPPSEPIRKGLFSPGMSLCGWIQCEEDHGYVVAIGQGARAVKAFLPRRSTMDHHGDGDGGVALRVGSLVDCIVSRYNASTNSLIVSLAPFPPRKPCSTDHMHTFQSLLPGTLVDAQVEAVLPGGLWLSFGPYFAGVVDTFNLPTPMPSSRMSATAAYKPKQRVLARIIMVDYEAKLVRLSMKPHVIAASPATFALDKRNGGLYDCLVVNDDLGIGVFVVMLERLSSSSTRSPAGAMHHGDEAMDHHHAYGDDGDDTPRSIMGGGGGGRQARRKKKVMRFGYIPGRDVLSLAERGEVLGVGSKLKCRVVGRNGMDGLTTLSCDPAALREPYMSIYELRAGEKVRGTVFRVHKDGLLVRLSRYLRGFCPALHASDMHLAQADRKYRVGQRVACRVLVVEPETNKLYLTLKPILVEDESTSVIASYQDAVPGAKAYGTIIGIRERVGLIISFYGGVKALCSREDLPDLHRDAPLQKCYRKGQVVRCTIIAGGGGGGDDGKHQHVYVSLRGGVPEDGGASRAGLLADGAEMRPLSVGSRVVGTVSGVVPEDRGRWVDVAGTKGWLPDSHLSDHASLIPAYNNVMVEGAVLEAMVVRVGDEREGRVMMLSKKPLLLAGAVEPHEDPLLPAYVRRVRKNGVVVAYANPHGRLMKALVPRAHVAAPPNHGSMKKVLAKWGMSIGSTVVCAPPQNSSTHTSDGDEPPMSIALVSNYPQRFALYMRSLLSERAGLAASSVADWSKYVLGGRVRGTVVAVRDFGILMDLDGGVGAVKGLCISAQLEDDVDEGDQVDGVVLDVDEATGCVDVSLLANVVHSVRPIDTSGSSKANVVDSEPAPAVVQLVKKNYVVATARNTVVYVVARQFALSASESPYGSYALGQSINVKAIAELSHPRDAVIAIPHHDSSVE